MKNSIILPSEFETIFMIEARKGGYIKHIDIGRDFSQIDSWEEQENAKKYRTKQKLFQMLLLYDELIFPDADPTYEYEKLQEQGGISIYPIDDYLQYNPLLEEGHLEFAEYLKPAIIPVASKIIRSYIRENNSDVTYNDIVSNIYDYALGIEKTMDAEVVKILNVNEELYKMRHHERTEKMLALNAPPAMFKDRFFHDLQEIVKTEYRTLCWELDISTKQGAYIINSKYQLSKIGCEELEKTAASSLAAYKILKCECAKIIGELPRMDNLDDVFELKTRRKKDIKNLKEELENLENIIKTEGKEQAIKKATEDVKKASNALAKRNALETIGKWTTLLSVPIGIVDELFCSPISHGLSIVATGGLITDEIIKSKNSWCEIVR